MKKNNLRTYLWLYLLVFSILILALLWIFYFTFLNNYYKYEKKDNMNRIAKEAVSIYYNTLDYERLNLLSFQNNVCIEIITTDNVIYTSGASNGCFVTSNSLFIRNRDKFINSSKKQVTFTFRSLNLNEELLVYGEKLQGKNYIFISTPLRINSGVSSIILRQFISGTIIVLVISSLIAYFMSKQISKPIININKKSKKMASGDYNITFDESNIEEINELSSTLNMASRELAKTEKLRRELLANVSHDLKTPLTLIKANAEMVKDITYKNEEKRNNNLDVIINEVDRLNLLVEDILDLSKAQSDTLKLDIKRLNLNDLIESVLTRYEVLQARDGYKINYNCDGNYVINADLKRIEQVIYNLINNAINFTGKDKKVNVNLVNKETFVRLEVVDTGKGIKKQDLKYIWDKYYKVDKSYHRTTVGTGLGLSIVKNILELHNFKYGVKTSSTGTNFYFDIPIE